MRSASLAVAVLLAVAASPAWGNGDDKPAATGSVPSTAPEGPAPKPASRFSFKRVEDGFLRLDGVTGQVSLCSPHNVGWACQAVPEDRAALDEEIARLQRQVDSLKRELASLRAEPVPPRPPADVPSAQAPKTKPQAKPGPKVESEPGPKPESKPEDSRQLRSDLERARAAFENAWRRLVEIIVNLQKDMMRKG